MRRIITTIASVVAIVVLLYWMFEAMRVGAPWIFNLVFVVMIVGFVISTVRTWIRG